MEALVTIHENLLYLVMGGVTPGHTVSAELEAIRASWVWLPIEPPYKHLEFGNEPFLLSDGAVKINAPELMHTYPSEAPDRILELGLYNIARNAPDFSVYARIAQLAAGQTLEQFKTVTSEGLLAKHVVEAPIEWLAPRNNPLRIASKAVGAETPNDASGRKPRILIRWAIVKLDDERLVLINFTLPQDAPPDGDVYSTLVDRIMDSIQIAAGPRRITDQGKPSR